jgi:primary-amine oxidase
MMLLQTKVPLRRSHRILAALGLAILIVSLNNQVLSAQPVKHPMDPLTAQEYSAVLAVLKGSNRISDACRYPLITLNEPSKSEVLKWKPGDALKRQAFVVVKDGPRTFEAIVDIKGGKLVSWKEVKGVQPGILAEEWKSAQEAVLGDAGWQAAARKRGFTNFDNIVCIPLTVGYYGEAEEQGRRLVKVPCFDSRGIHNFWGRPIEGLTAVVDLESDKVIKVIDTGAVPLPQGRVDFDEKSVGKLREAPKPLEILQPQGSNFTIDGHLVNWQKWQFHFRVDPRSGLVVSRVAYKDQSRMRSILYEGSVSELFVPYMDPDLGWYFRTYMDAGEYGVGKLAAPLVPGTDCPSNAQYFDAIFADDKGNPYPQQRAACLFERNPGDMSWRHYESVTGQNESRKKTELVLRLVSAIGNYDYIFDWVFCQNGTIRVALGSSGIEQVKGVGSRTTDDDNSGRDTAYGHMVAEHTVAVNHDHFFNFRLDLDVDGPQNTFEYETMKMVPLGKGSARRSLWVADTSKPKTEKEAQLRMSFEKPAIWRVINPNVKGPLGYPVSYQLRYEANAVSLLSPTDFPQRRAGFTNFHLWVTPYKADERYAGGMYPNESKGGDGLPNWTRANRPIVNTDIVLWYTLGFHHMVRAEDWPVLPTVWTQFELRPFDFFDRNPALDLPK